MQLFPIYVISYMANNVLPLRIGDIYRAYIAGKKFRVSKTASLVTIGVERIFDGLTMLLMLAMAFLFYPVTDERVKQAIHIGSIVFLTAIVISYIVMLNQKLSEGLFKKTLPILPEKYHPKLNKIFHGFFEGLASLKGFSAIAGVIILSIATWLIEAGSYYCVLISFGFTGHLHVAVATMAMVNLMIIVPSAPGYFGPFELACVVILGKTGYGNLTQFTEEIAAAYALVLHVIVQWIPSTLLGLLYMWKEHINFHEINDDTDSSKFSIGEA
jgi:glycosyltransferase 2 family protein